MKKILLILVDGVADRIYDELDAQTPLEAAQTPNLDRIAAKGGSAALYPIAPGLVPPSEIPHFHLFGYADDPFPGRAVLESLGWGVVPPRDAAVTHLGLRHVTPGPDGLAIADWWPGADDVEADARDLIGGIAAFESEGIRMEARYLGKSDYLLILHGGSEFITDSDPFFFTGHPVLEVAALDAAADQDLAQKTARALNAYLRWCNSVLDDHPVNRRRRAQGLHPLNMTVTKWTGRHYPLKDFHNRSGLNGTIISSARMYAGMAAALGMGFKHVDEDMQDPAGEMADKLAAARAAFEAGADFVHLHTKTADEAAHAHSPQAKRDVIAASDRGLAGLWDWPSLDKDFVVAATADHATPSHGPMLHSGESVPFALMGAGVRRDEVTRFGERAAVHGSLGQLRARDALPVMLNAANRARFLGGRPAPDAGFGAPEVTPLML
jgi:2,3-bisphosphoglycerate-independent phosphoglycerate mutase